MLVCVPCAEQNADEEIERISLLRFAAGQAPLFRTDSMHLLPSMASLGTRRALTLCRKKRFVRPDGAVLYRKQFVERYTEKDLCRECFKKATAALEVK